MDEDIINISDFILDFDESITNEKMLRDERSVAFKKENPQEKVFVHYYEMENFYTVRRLIEAIETRVLANHPAIQPIVGYSFLLDKNKLAIIEPFLQNNSLSKFIQDNRQGEKIPNFETIRSIIIFGIASGMAYLEQINLFKKSLTLNHILLDDNMHPKISNFIEMYYESDLSSTAIPSLPIYVAPEILYDNYNVSPRSDVFSFSMILYQLLNFDVDLPSKTKKSLFLYMKFIENGGRPEINTEKIPKIWADLIKECWNQNPNDRPSFIEIVKKFISQKQEFFSNPEINQDELDHYIQTVTGNLNLINA